MEGGDGMAVYLDLVVLLNFCVDFLLLIASSRLAGYRCGFWRAIVASAVGAIYAGSCMLPGFYFLQGLLWRLVCLSVISVIAFGCSRSAIRRAVLFVFLSMALGGAAMGITCNHFLSLLLCAGGILLLCVVGVGGRITGREYVPVELALNGKRFQLTALKDTGNTLSDPVTGQQVLIVGSDVAWDILGLTPQQLSDPIGTMASLSIHGLRLIPYNSVGRSSGMLLGVTMDSVTIAGQPAGRLVGFAPDAFRNAEGYQGLTGGIV